MLGVSQVVLETEYYMIDLFDILDKYRKHRAIEQLQAIQVATAPNMTKEDYEKYVRSLMKEAGIKQEEKFDREKMDALHAFTAQMKQMGG